MEKQTLLSSQMQELIELGIDTSKASMCIMKNTLGEEFIVENTLMMHSLFLDAEFTPTFTLQDILEMLPYHLSLDKECYLTIRKDKNDWLLAYMYDEQYWLYECEKSLLKAAFNMLKWCKQNNHI